MLSVAWASIVHVAVDVESVPANHPAVVAAQTEAQGQGLADTATTAERCHTCSIVAFVAPPQVFGINLLNSEVAARRSPDLVGFEQPSTAPPPRA